MTEAEKKLLDIIRNLQEFQKVEVKLINNQIVFTVTTHKRYSIDYNDD